MNTQLDYIKEQVNQEIANYTARKQFNRKAAHILRSSRTLEKMAKPAMNARWVMNRVLWPVEATPLTGRCRARAGGPNSPTDEEKQSPTEG
jgi:hypothetical protein